MSDERIDPLPLTPLLISIEGTVTQDDGSSGWVITSVGTWEVTGGSHYGGLIAARHLALALPILLGLRNGILTCMRSP